MKVAISTESDDHDSRYILGMRVDYTTYVKAAEKIVELSQKRGRGYICISNVHMVMEAYDDPEFKKIVNCADLVTPDGMPLVWGLRILGIRKAQRVYGPTLTSYVCREAEVSGRGLPTHGACSLFNRSIPVVRDLWAGSNRGFCQRNTGDCF
jgi:N-acetylglucosaminyldiphosphoundecaprenol N-acetyl-beta-D-mannosaminyltransferase